MQLELIAIWICFSNSKRSLNFNKTDFPFWTKRPLSTIQIENNPNLIFLYNCYIRPPMKNNTVTWLLLGMEFLKKCMGNYCI